MKEPCLVPVGIIVRTHGIRGALKIHPYGESLFELVAGDRLMLRSGQEAALTLVNCRIQGKAVVCSFAEITSIDEAQPFVGQEVFLPVDSLPPTSDDEYYHFQLIGLIAETPDGDRIGILRTIIETGGNDVYVVDRDGKEILVPAIEGVICKVDLEAGKMVVDLPEGLVDDL